MSQLLRIGVIGCGDFATRALWPSLRYASVEIAYACARRPERAYDNARVFGAQRATTNVEEVLADDSVPAVLVIGPPQMHFELGTAALEAGKHLFIEKPPAATLTQTTQLAETARRAGVQCQVGFQKRSAPGYQWARKTAADSRFGPAQLLKVNYSHWRMPDWRAHLYDDERAPHRSGPVLFRGPRRGIRPQTHRSERMQYLCTNVALLVGTVRGNQYVRKRSTRAGMGRNVLLK